MNEQKLINKRLLGCWTTMVVLLVLAYIIEIFKHTRTAGYVLIFSLVTIIPLVIAYSIYKAQETSVSIRYVCMIGFSITYAFVLFTGNTVVVFIYAWLLLIAITMTNDVKAILIYGSSIFILNVASTIYDVIAHGDNAVDTATREIQLIACFISIIFSYISTKTSSEINEKKVSDIKEAERHQSAMLHNMAAVSEIVKGNTASMLEQLDVLNDASNRTTSAMEEIVAGSSQTTNLIEEQLALTNTIQGVITDSTQMSSEISQLVDITTEKVEQGVVNMQTLSDSATTTNENSSIVLSQMQQLKNTAEEVQNVVSIISEITSMTNLLALNASIEAARAGEAGRGFAVVASEINGLAQQTAEATTNIKHIIQELQTKADEATSIVETMTKMNGEQNDIIFQTETAFNEIKDCISNVKESADKQAETMSALVSSNKQIVESINNISAISEEVMSNSQQTQGLSEDNLRATKQVDTLANELMESVEQLSAE